MKRKNVIDENKKNITLVQSKNISHNISQVLYEYSQIITYTMTTFKNISLNVTCILQEHHM